MNRFPLAAFALALLHAGVVLAASPAPTGRWYAQLVPAQGHEVSFETLLESRGGVLSATLLNGKASAPFTSAAWDGETLTLQLAHFDVSIEAKVVKGAGKSAETLFGTYRRVTAGGPVEVPFRASRTAPVLPRLARGAKSIAGDWAVDLGEGAGKETLLGILRQSGPVVEGTLRSTTGDYGALHGTFDGKHLLLQVFNGVHVYRFDAELDEDGTLEGEFRSRTSPPVPWIGRRLTADESRKLLPDLFGLVKPRDPSAPFRFSFSTADGKTVSSEDLLGKPMVVSLMGTWCPNCNDEAPVLQDIATRYGPKGLAVVALAFEYTEDVERSRKQIRRFVERYRITYPVLLAGTTKGAPTGPVIQQLEGWKGYPTTLFLDREHRIVKTHSGFDGPATGTHFKDLKVELEGTVSRLLAAPESR